MAIYDSPDDWFNGNKVKTRKSKGAGGGFTLRFNRISSKPKTAKAIAATNKKLPQVMVKISGSSKGADKAQAHANYIGRKGEVNIEDQEGNIYKGDEQKNLLKAWEATGFNPVDKEGKKREAFHFVFSMPKGTNPDALKSAVRNLVKEEFEGHKFFMAQHLDTDSPHVHVLLNATDDRGARLNPRKTDLHNYRVQFVHKLAEQGIEATASRRIHRFKYQDNKTQAQIHKEQRTGQMREQRQPKGDSKKKIERTHQQIADAYESYQQNLASDDPIKQEITKLLKNQLKPEKDKGR